MENYLLWIYALIAILIVTIVAVVIHKSMRNKRLANAFIIAMVVGILFFTHFYVVPYFVAWSVEKDLKKNPFLVMLATHSPQEYDTYLGRLRENILDRGDINQQVYLTSQFINHLLMKYGPRASNESLYNYLKTNIMFNKKLLAIDPLLVLFHEYPEKFKHRVDLAKYQSNTLDDSDATLIATENVIRSGIEHPAPLPNWDEIKEADKIFQDIIHEVALIYGQEQTINALQKPDGDNVNKETAAKIIILVSEKILAKGEKTVGLLLKSSFLVNQKAGAS